MEVKVTMPNNAFTRLIAHPLVRSLLIAAAWTAFEEAVKAASLVSSPWGQSLLHVLIAVRLVILASPYASELPGQPKAAPEVKPEV